MLATLKELVRVQLPSLACRCCAFSQVGLGIVPRRRGFVLGFRVQILNPAFFVTQGLASCSPMCAKAVTPLPISGPRMISSCARWPDCWQSRTLLPVRGTGKLSPYV